MLFLVVAAGSAFAASINITTASGWTLVNVSGSAVNVAAPVYSGGISVTSNSYGSGTYASGVSSFDGYWVAYYAFTGQAGGTLTASQLYADDKVVLELNPSGFSPATPGLTGCSNVIAAASWSTGTGPMYCTDATSTSVAFNFANSLSSGPSLSSSNLVNGTNYLVAIINNTGSMSVSAGKNGFTNNTTDQTIFLGNFTYTDPAPSVPEPSTLAYFLIGAAPLAYRFASKLRRQ